MKLHHIQEGSWFPVVFYFDVDGLTYETWIDGNAVHASPVPFQADGTLGAMDLFSIDGNNEHYFDDFHFLNGVLGADDFSADVFSVYPNPVTDILNISTRAAVDSVVVYDILGKVVIQAKPDAISPSINMGALSSGAYLVQVTIGDASKTIKVIK